MDEKSCSFNYWLVEGGRLGKMYDAGDFELRVTPKSDGGCVLKVKGAYHAYEDVKVTDDDMNVGKLGLTAMYLAVEAYLVDQSHALNSLVPVIELAYEDVKVTDDDMNVGKLGLTAMYSAVEAYLVANPDAYASP
ncbi:hypothetical protein Syun_007995 [Stephania yunnanensis]|uniref:Uncharacterized protein n=1 Tax=Stephania yunnanensis TaxID=152371 RepID=A0AAP0L3A4_9MAGN